MPALTLFVSSLPNTATNEHIEEIFSEIGPVKQCFVVNEKGTKTCRGFGYVTFSMEEDARQALKTIKEYDGYVISLSVAKGKITDKKKPAPKKPVPEEKEQKAKGARKSALKARLIVRNLSFKCSEDNLRDIFGKFGTVLEAKIPLKTDGKMRGFAFVQFKSLYEAGKALTAMNLKEIKGRQVAVDWAVAKDKYVSTQSSFSQGPKLKDEAETNQLPTDTKSDIKEQKGGQKASQQKKVPSKIAVKQEDDKDDSLEEDCDDDEEAVFKDEEDNSLEEDCDDDEEAVFKDGEDDSLEEEEYDDDEEDDEESASKKQNKKPLPSDVNKGRTVFIRNLSFDTEDEQLEVVLLQYGELKYIRIVLHPDTEHSKGCAFAQFKTKEGAEKCIAAAQCETENGGVRVDGRKLVIVEAMSKDDAVKLKDKKTKVETGSRNLYLAREGLIRAGTKAAEGVPETDMIKRTRFEEMKRAKLRDIHVFVSKTRLCIHNLPKSVDSKKLKTLCLQAVKGSKGVRVTECRVMYDKKPEKGQAMGHSLGYGFVQFQEHKHALSTLRYLNNNPDIFGAHKRPVIEFSLEDGRKLKLKELRQQKNKEHFKNMPGKGNVKHPSKTPGDGAGFKSGQVNKERASLQNQKQEKNFSGFQTKPELEYVELEDGKKKRKILHMPSHRGPKIRKRDKGKPQVPPPKKARTLQSRKERKGIQAMEKATQSRPQSVKPAKTRVRKDKDHFDSLVEQYKKKLIGNGNMATNLKRNKWFSS